MGATYVSVQWMNGYSRCGIAARNGQESGVGRPRAHLLPQGTPKLQPFTEQLLMIKTGILMVKIFYN